MANVRILASLTVFKTRRCPCDLRILLGPGTVRAVRRDFIRAFGVVEIRRVVSSAARGVADGDRPRPRACAGAGADSTADFTARDRCSVARAAQSGAADLDADDRDLRGVQRQPLSQQPDQAL